MLVRSSVASGRALAPVAANASASSATRQFAVLSDKYSPLFVKRKGEQVASAPIGRKTVSKTSQGVTVATYDDMGPVSTLAVVLGGGSRHNDAHHPGLAHIVKTSLIRNLPGDNIVRTIRETELRGDTLSTELTRENIIVRSEFLRDDLVDAVPLLLKSVFNPHFYPYEFLDTMPKVVAETAASLTDPSTTVLENLHRVAFRTGLGNPLFASEDSLHGMTRAHVAEFVGKYFSPERTAIVGVGISHADLIGLVEGILASVKLGGSQAAATIPATKYFGGEAAAEGGPHSEAHVAVAFPSVAFTSPDYPVSLVLRALLDSTPRTLYATASSGLLSPAITADTSVSAIHAAYSDAGLIGFYAKGASSDMKTVVQTGIQALASAAAGVSESALARAKKVAIVEAEAALENKAEKVADLGRQVLSSIGGYHTSADLADAISKVSARDVAKLASTAVKAKPSMSSYGNLGLLPYLDEVKL
ncbi:hypothetical protein SmJEL517_g05092 [Synchytrium microbalum]|uniref:Cytochrome b-c1 complex subunit 2, mitochondrial n=1 Tax=Synchytrium microbalum TaxID=1806994 RepID=A0A507C227_9FUNG|nr:uncharacterized protein SmJEL517_g05092 [Synchytrium microbalum]TPX31585.1 hypothetical protein SmJEL517_g05092 [Synchytrium microbalum]